MSDSPKIDPQRLAAALDGRLNDRERDAVMHELAGSEADMEILADVLAVEQEASGAPAILLRPKSATKRWSGFAAAAAVILVAGSLYYRGDAVTLSNYGDGIAAILAGWDAHPWGLTRGTAGTAENVTAVRLGARLVDLSIASRGNDPAAAEISAEMAAMIAELPAGAELSRRVAAVTEATTADEREERIDGVETALRARFNVTSLQLGAWLEAARFAAQARDVGFFRSKVSRQTLAQELTSENENARTAWNAIRASVGSAEPEWVQLHDELTRMLAILGA